jgi:hypothetical protein
MLFVALGRGFRHPRFDAGTNLRVVSLGEREVVAIDFAASSE